MAQKILIIDDEEDMRIFLETLFRKAGYDTASAVNGDEALQLLDEMTPDLITLDILMPRKSGLTFFEILRQNENLKKTPVVVLSGVTRHSEFFTSEDDIQGPTEFIEKPVEPQVLLDCVSKLLQN